MLAIGGASDYELGSDSFFSHIPDRRVGKDILIFPELLINDWGEFRDIDLKPWFDTLWNSVGFKECTSFKGDKWSK